MAGDLITPSHGVIAALRASVTAGRLAATGHITDTNFGKGVYRQGGVPPKVPFPLIVVNQQPGVTVYHHGGIAYETFRIVVMIEDEQRGLVAQYQRGWVVADAVDKELNNGYIPNDAYIIHRFFRDVGASEKPGEVNGIATVEIVWRYIAWATRAV